MSAARRRDHRLGAVLIPRDPPHFLPVRLALRRHISDHLSSPERDPGAAEVIVGLSGGPDSTALLAAALVEGLRVHAVVIDHGLQPGSGLVAAKAASIAVAMGASASVWRVAVTGPGGMEAAARAARYAALERASRGRPILVGHTREDQAETYLLGALRGNPAGMLPVSGGLHRPLLGVRRADTQGACAELGLEPWHDPQNRDTAFRRVALRRRVIPGLADALGVGDLSPALAQAADRAAEDAAALEEWARRAETRSAAELAALPRAVRSRVLARMVHDAGGKVTGASMRALDALVMNWRGQGPVAVGAGLAVTRADGKLTVTREKGVRHAR
ncbi:MULTISPECIES: tRNA lysidine(34) synthetase TilS [unclassified Corynebacterium]|uniref:tRNA lysidine(34) synthetase TilS n=1 Tax=unclassified Corynebacterium TaxID=2624378 RepID=UPI0029CA0AF3|nr:MULTISPECIES: tRNA lysidine(34) synthetase TilS [unclassified Corynebacterium]WPF65867.1 tRNA lysidine(34) synthetase TilS [Corynebacterium sp. 22KM0430]WPF68360.1 tRNA lysidine(34) synthetase TilS [Corynebacterium sp. 21KM1197]